MEVVGLNAELRAYLRAVGSIGGKARMASLTVEQRRKLARKAGKQSGKIRRAAVKLRNAA